MTWLAGGKPATRGIGKPGRLEADAGENNVSVSHAWRQLPPGAAASSTMTKSTPYFCR